MEKELLTNNECVDRFKLAILNSAISDFTIHSSALINKYDHNEPYEIEVWELKKVIEFIKSDWFVYLTNGNSPQLDCIKKLINKNLPIKYKTLLLKEIQNDKLELF